VASNDRITIPTDMSATARASERLFEAASSDVRESISPRSIPWLVMVHDDLLTLPLDGRSGFVLSLVDGRCTVEMILDVAGLPEDDVIDILRLLRDLGAIELRDDPKSA
jgi:hypothetical protein